VKNAPLHNARRLVVLAVAIGSIAAYVDCPGTNQPGTLLCRDFALHLEPDTCALIANPCSVPTGTPPGEWLSAPRTDGFRLFGEPASLYVRTERSSGVTTRSICSAGDATFVNASMTFKYGISNTPDFGTGHLTVTVTPHFSVTVTAQPAAINLGEASQLVAAVSGGSPPYSYRWIPTSGLNVTNNRTPVASPSVTTTYVVYVTDSAGQTVEASVTVGVTMALRVTANPSLIALDDASQLDATVEGGMLPYTFAWLPADSLDDPTFADPAASPRITTVYTVVATDANGVTRTGAVEVGVLLESLATANPATIAAGQMSQLDANPVGGDGVYTFAWVPAAGLSNPAVRNPVASPTMSTTYTVTVTDGHGQTASRMVPVTVTTPAAPPTAAFTTSATFNPPLLHVDASASTGTIVSYAWELSCTAASPDLVSSLPTATFPLIEGCGTITLTVTAADGQTATLSRRY
jgi:hypothetical protein